MAIERQIIFPKSTITVSDKAVLIQDEEVLVGQALEEIYTTVQPFPLREDQMKELTKKVVSAGLVDRHVLELMYIWGLDVAAPDPDKVQSGRLQLAKFVEELDQLVMREIESYPVEVEVDER